MSKTAYTEEEIIHVLNTHREQKYRSKEFQLLETSDQEAEIEALRHQLSILRTYTEQSQEETSKLKKFQTEITEKLAFVESEKERLSKENEHYKNQINLNQTSSEIAIHLHEAQEINVRQKNRIDKLTTTLAEKDRKIIELQQFEYSFKKSGEQKLKQQEELDKLKSMLQKTEDDKISIQSRLEKVTLHADQVEMSSLILKKEQEEAQQKIHQLQEELSHAKISLQAHANEHKLLSKGLEEQKIMLQQAIVDRNESSEELLLIQSQFEGLKNKIYESNLLYEKSNIENKASQELIQLLRNEKAQLEEQLMQKSKALDSFDQEIEIIKQTLVRGMREAKEIESRYQETISEKISAVNKLNQVQHLIDTQKKEITQSRHLLNESVSKEKLLQEEIAQITKKYSSQALQLEQFQAMREDLRGIQHRLETTQQDNSDKEIQIQKFHDLLQQKESENQDLNQRIKQLLHQKVALEDDLRNHQNIAEDRDQRIKLAQQHLAKKLKETTILTEKVDEQRTQLTELTNQVAYNKEKISELQSHLENQLIQEKSLQEQLKENLKQMEVQSNKWEAKCLSLHEKLDEADKKNRDLRSLEERYNQMQMVLSSLGNFIGTPPHVPTPAAPNPIKESAAAKRLSIDVESQKVEVTPKPDQHKTLFESSANTLKSKKTLFD